MKVEGGAFLWFDLKKTDFQILRVCLEKEKQAEAASLSSQHEQERAGTRPKFT